MKSLIVSMSIFSVPAFFLPLNLITFIAITLGLLLVSISMYELYEMRVEESKVKRSGQVER